MISMRKGAPDWVTPTASWMAGTDKDFKRPAQDILVDKQLAKALGLKEGDKLPPLDPGTLAELKKTDRKTYDKYMKKLPKVSQSQKDMAVLKLGGDLADLLVGLLLYELSGSLFFLFSFFPN